MDPKDTINALKLSASGARKVLDAALAAVAPTGRPVSIAVVDEGGHLMAFARTDDSELYTIQIAIRKARAAALTRFPTGRLSPTGNIRDDHHSLGITLAAGTDNFVCIEGGVPIIVNGQVIGGISVSGAGKKDPELAQMAIDAVLK